MFLQEEAIIHISLHRTHQCDRQHAICCITRQYFMGVNSYSASHDN